MVHTGGTLPYHARFDNWRASDHGSDQEKNSRIILHNPDPLRSKGERCTTYDASEEKMSGEGELSSEVNVLEASLELCGFLVKSISFLC